MNDTHAPHDVVTIHTDGACSGNPGPGGWGAVLRRGDKYREISGREPDTTSNRMEMLAVIQALSRVRHGSTVVVCTDSAYVRGGMTKWLADWKRNGWRTSGKKPVKNEDLWRGLDEQAERHAVEWRWVEAHAGDPDNERADKLAREAIRTRQK